MSKCVFVFLILCVVTMWAMALNCQSCGKECAPACGTRYFRTCCFNYLRRKRGYHAQMNILPQRFFEDVDTWSQDPTIVYESI